MRIKRSVNALKKLKAISVISPSRTESPVKRL